MAGLGIPDNFSSDDEPPSKLHKHLVIISGCIFWIFALFLALALGSYNPSDPSFNTSTSQSPTNLLGYTGSYFSDFFIQGFGISSFLPVIVFSAWGWRIVRHHLLNGFIVRIIALICLIPVISAVISAIPLFIEPDMVIRWPSNSGIGGSIGLVLAKTAFAAAQDLMGKSGHILVWVLGLLFCVLLIPLCMGLSRQEWRRILGLFPFLFRILFRKRSIIANNNNYTKMGQNTSTRSYKEAANPFRTPYRKDQMVSPYQESIRSSTREITVINKSREPSLLAPDNTPIYDPQLIKEKEEKHPTLTPAIPHPISTGNPLSDPEPHPNNYEDEEQLPPPLPKPKGIFSLLHRTPKELSSNHASLDNNQDDYADSHIRNDENVWNFPPLSLLRSAPVSNETKPTEEMLQANARMLETVLADYGVQGTIGNILSGPVVTLYELEPAPGIRSARVIGLSDDIARSLAVISVRIATVPGRNVIGIEVPNNIREMVYLSELLNTEAWVRNTARLCLAIGKNIFGEPIYANLAKMPHLLIAGTTGSGKSVGVNAMILSLLYRLSPDECRLILIDPKMLELSIYEGIPHLLTPVVTDPHKAVSALKWAVREMERRYRAMSQLGVRNIDGYNQRITMARNQRKVMTRRVQTGYDPETGKPTFEEQQIPLEHFPYIVVIIDEMADLMMVAGKEIEAAVQRLAQMARAAGIHVIMATQRPSVDVITGTIKANFPTRISFQVISKFDSRTILGEQGAEQLLGQGDMLFMQAGGRIVRVHGPFVSDDEVEKVVEHLRKQGEPIYVEDVTVEPIDEKESGSRSDNSSDELYNQALAIVLREGKASTSFIQRHLSIGYNRAAKIIEQMEKERIVSPANHVGKREILVKRPEKG